MSDEIINKTILKKYEYSQINLLIDSSGNKFIEKIKFHNPPVIPLTFKYDSNELEIIESILQPLEIPHAQIISSIKNKESTAFVMDFIDGIECKDEPKADYLYLAAEKIGAVYNKSKMNLSCVDRTVLEKYTLSKEKILNCINVICKHHKMQPIDSLIDFIFEKYKDRIIFVNHNDMQFKNFIYNDDLQIFDWECVQISPFFTDLYLLTSQAYEVGADINEIKNRYLKHSQLSFVSDEDIKIAGIICNIRAVFELLIFDCPIEWLEGSYNALQDLILNLRFYDI